MKNSILVICLNFIVVSISAQQITRPVRLKTGMLTAATNLRNRPHLIDSLKKFHYRHRFYTLIQFNKLPNEAERQALAQQGIVLYDYISGNSYLAELNDNIAVSTAIGANNNIGGLYTLPANAKISPELIEDLKMPVRDRDMLIAVSFYGTIDKAAAIAEFRKAGAQIMETDIQPAQAVFIDASTAAIQKIAALPFVSYISSQYMKSVPLNYKNRGAHAVNALSAAAGRNLQGSNVTVGVGDDGNPTTHVDFAGRLVSRLSVTGSDHATHISGSVGGAGILNPKFKGMAPQTTILNLHTREIVLNAPYNLADYNMVLTNNSYAGGATGCRGGHYDLFSNGVDAQLNSYPSLLHVFAAGNDGTTTCSPYPRSFGTVCGGYQSAKNVLTVGATDNAANTIASLSSRGPTVDGRVKPELVAGGWAIGSTVTQNRYATYYGTSCSAPTVTGILALLHERYRQLNGGSNPSATLIKALACNGADDMGNPGPDYTFGFGKINARNSIEAIEKNAWFTGTTGQGGSATFTIPAVPPGSAQIKILLYWNDPVAAAGAVSALVNDLDLTVTAPDATVHHPLVLDNAAANVNNPAVEGVDSRNNIEQVVINNPPAGSFTITVKGTGIAQGPQDYVVVYQIIQSGVIVDYPFGEETLVPGEAELIRWSAADPNTNPFTIEYSLDNGGSWAVINNNVPATSRFYNWIVPPSIATGAALIRVSRNNTPYTDASDLNFTILDTTTVTVTNSCPGYVGLSWSSIPGATSYDIMQLKGSGMEVVASTTATSYLLGGLRKDTTCWLAVRGVMGAHAGRRSVAKDIIPSGGSCVAADFDNDLSPEQLVAPVTGRMYTSSQLGTAAPQVRIVNNGAVASSGSAIISYQVNNGAPVSETAVINIAPHSNYTYTFTSGYDFSNTGKYTIKVWIDYSGDGLHRNDTLTAIIKHLQNDAIVLNHSFVEGFESAAKQAYFNGTMGFDGLDRCDFNSNDIDGRARTFINTAIVRSGNRAVTLERRSWAAGIAADSLVMTFNLGNYTTNSRDLWLSLYFRSSALWLGAAGNQVWIRGSDRDAWISAYAMPARVGKEVYLTMPMINMGELLANASPAQTVTSSFQVKLGWEGSFYTTAPTGINSGNTFDDVTILLRKDDVGVVQLVQPTANGCALSASEPVTVQVKNYSSSTVANVPVSYRVNNGTPVTEYLASIAPGATVNYTFTQTADLSAFTQYTVTACTQLATDTYSSNDTLVSAPIRTLPHITSYPYLEKFEDAHSGYWYAGGVNSSWQCGTPAGALIKNAASGNKAWVTNLSGNYNNIELSYLNSPCFDLSGLKQPVLSFSHIFKTEDTCNCDVHWVEYSADGQTWNKLGTPHLGTNWYDNDTSQVWLSSIPRWQVSSFAIPTKGAAVRFRIVFRSDSAATDEGIGIDDVHISDGAPVYNGGNITGGLSKGVSGNDWVNFTADAGGEKIIAAIHPNGQDLGNTNLKLYINKDAVRNDGYQYYLDRNIVIQPGKVPVRPVKLRFYFLHTEADRLIAAGGCNTCSTVPDAYAAGITQYSNAPAEEDGILNNNGSGMTQFLPPSQVDVIPYDNGYYAEYEVSRFSECWINGGGPGHDLPLSAPMNAFTVTRVGSTALLQWSTYKEINTDRFIIERSTDSINFIFIGIVTASGNSTTLKQYQFTDEHPEEGNNYYRIKLIDKDAKFSYTAIRKLYYGDVELIITLKPNPVTNGVVYISSTVNCNRIDLHDATGRLIKTVAVSGQQPQLPVPGLARGVYIITVVTDGGRRVAKVVVE